jgi:hypothetical protein
MRKLTLQLLASVPDAAEISDTWLLTAIQAALAAGADENADAPLAAVQFDPPTILTSAQVPEPPFEHLGSLITRGDTYLSHLVYFAEHGVYEPNLGRVAIDPQYVEPHNQALDAALLAGLDNHCEIGQGGFFYLFRDAAGAPAVKTFTGQLVSADVTVRGKTITFRRQGKTFRGRQSEPETDAFNFRRAS